MTHKPKHFTLIDPRELDGDPFDVAERACQQAAALAGILGESLEPVRIIVRNAELERQLQGGGSADAEAWERGPQALRLDGLKRDLEAAKKGLTVLATAASYNPKNPPKE